MTSGKACSAAAHLMRSIKVRLMVVQRRHIHVKFVYAQLGIVVQPLVDVWPLTEQRCHTG